MQIPRHVAGNHDQCFTREQYCPIKIGLNGDTATELATAGHRRHRACLLLPKRPSRDLCYGLRSDFLGEPFEGSKYLLSFAEELSEIKTICQCGKKGTMNMRIDSEGNPVTSGEQVQIGGNESYLSCCMKCFKNKVKIPVGKEEEIRV